MLVLTRMVNETIMIGDQIEIVIVDVKGGRVKIGVRAPNEVPVHRKEIYIQIKQENHDARSPALERLEGIARLFGRRGARDPM